jgi:uncharacterized membrane-anchored protein YhcB (DUF1043 family)
MMEKWRAAPELWILRSVALVVVLFIGILCAAFVSVIMRDRELKAACMNDGLPEWRCEVMIERRGR